MFEIKPQKITRPYEAVVLMDSAASEQEQKALFTKNKSIIESFGGKLNHIDTWGVRPIANPIKKHSRANYFHCTFTAEPSAIAELERTMKINEKVLRYHHARLADNTSLAKHVEAFKESLAETNKREKEREAKFKAKKAAKSRPEFEE